jgi:exopolysaccharide biosynthesis predicted pyruvyltransferase EpsI
MKRIECIEKVKSQIITAYAKIVPSNTTVHLFDIPMHTNYGDSLIW